MRIQDFEEPAGRGFLDTCRVVGDAWEHQDNEMFSAGCMAAITVMAATAMDNPDYLFLLRRMIERRLSDLVDAAHHAHLADPSHSAPGFAATLLANFCTEVDRLVQSEDERRAMEARLLAAECFE